ncbi:hypothetical protein HHK36_020045 [Tetracentron sinense]|uniref:Uncharacterized protein n=1 Tax=Tetracentron sinense TaxID=13715 RepID=A0A834YYS1_TETSI|nr:hypothetical protein HHK36_020045 [Tetracentron sinense]
MLQHVCTFALYSHHFVTRLNQDFLQCAVYDSDDSTGHLIGVEYIVTDRIFGVLPPEEQKLWHTHAYVEQMELQKLAKSYGKLPLGAPSAMSGGSGDGPETE